MVLGLAVFATLQLSNLLYVAAAIVVATLISALIALRHRRPKSLESGIESFSRELRALAPEPEGIEGRATRPRPSPTGVALRPKQPAPTRGAGRRPPGEHYRSPAQSSLDDGKRPASRRPGLTGSGDPGDAGGESTRTDGQAG